MFKVQSHTVWPSMCMCCGLFAPTQFHVECCAAFDDIYMYIFIYGHVYVCLYIYMDMCMYVFMFLCMYVLSMFRDLESGLSKDLKDGEPCLRRANAGGGSWRY